MRESSGVRRKLWSDVSLQYLYQFIACAVIGIPGCVVDQRNDANLSKPLVQFSTGFGNLHLGLGELSGKPGLDVNIANHWQETSIKAVRNRPTFISIENRSRRLS